nr:cysteine synthase family protein [Streptomyces antimycoticus]
MPPTSPPSAAAATPGDTPCPPPVSGNPVLKHVSRAVAAYPVTPVRTVRAEIAGIRRTITLKLEGHSPWRSVKGRTALSLIRSVASDLTAPGATVVESTSGNLGLALSAICRDLGLRFIAVVDHRQSPVIQQAIEANGGELDWVRTPDDATTHLQDRLARVRELERDLPHAVWPNQYENDANWRIHETWTAPEFDAQVEDGAQALFAGVSTGGTLAGPSRHFRRTRPGLRIVAVDVRGSTVFGGIPRPRALTGIGASRRSAFLTPACGCRKPCHPR